MYTSHGLYKPVLKTTVFDDMFHCIMQVPSQAQGGCFTVLNKKRGVVFDNQTLPTGQVVLKAHLPVQESFGKQQLEFISIISDNFALHKSQFYFTAGRMS